jgi:O-antigen/teichoic acid export membrane protein
MLRYSLPLLPNALFAWLVSYADRFFVLHLLGASAVGSYAVCMYLGGLPTLLVTPLAFSIFPLLTRLYDEQRLEELRSYLHQSARVFLYLAAAVVAGVTMLAEPVMNGLVGKALSIDSHAVFLIGLAYVCQGMYQLYVYAFHLVKRTDYTLRVLLFVVPLNLLLDATLIAPLGLPGAAIATALTYLAMASYTVHHARKLIGATVPWTDFARACLAGAACALVLHFQAPRDLPAIALAILLGGSAWLAALWISGGIRRADLAQLRAALRRKPS